MSHLLRVAQMRDECPGRARPWSIFFLPVLGVFFVFSCSGLKLDKESNCRNSQASCFKADKTSPKVQGFSTQPAPDASNYISSLNYFDVTFSEELKDGENKSKYSFIQDASHNFQVSLVLIPTGFMRAARFLLAAVLH
jgi:hypothetical protein